MIKAKRMFELPKAEKGQKQKISFKSLFECRQKWEISGEVVEICVVKFKAKEIRFLTPQTKVYTQDEKTKACKPDDVFDFEGLKFKVAAVYDRQKQVSVALRMVV